MSKRLVRSVLLASIGAAATAAGAQQLPLEQCQQLKGDIERYTALRRNGGPSAQMDAWKRARREREREFHRGNCRYYRFELR